MCLNFALAILWTFPLWLNYRKKWAWILVVSLTPLFLLAILLTYTRSIWMGTAAIVVILMLTMLKGKSRTLALGSLFVSGAMTGLIIGPNLVAFKREYTEAETLESTRMRGAFAYVSYQMIFDKPIAGFGFNQFQVFNRPYLDDRTTNIRLESIRGYVHHNSYLSLLVDLGLVGGVLFLAATIAFMRTAWTLWSHPLASSYYKSGAVLFFCVLPSMPFRWRFMRCRSHRLSTRCYFLLLPSAKFAGTNSSRKPIPIVRWGLIMRKKNPSGTTPKNVPEGMNVNRFMELSCLLGESLGLNLRKGASEGFHELHQVLLVLC